MSDIDWNAVQEYPEVELLNLGDLEIDNSVSITFSSVRELPNGGLVADISSPDGDWGAMWLKGKFGLQNGALSLMKISDGGKDIEGGTYSATKISSDKSPAGYAFRWTL
mgnify:CR=1 FL=1